MPVPADPNVVYPEIQSFVKVGEDAVTAEQMKEWLGWEDEDTYKQRMEKKDKKKATVGFGEEYLLKDPAGKKIRCWYNTKNRPFSHPWAKALAQDLLHSGPGIAEDDRAWQVNGEPIIFGKYGQCLSGQHRGVALILAVHEYRKNKEFWAEKGGWESDPVMECIVTVGINESPSTTRTLDNVKPRSLSDVFYTSGIFDKLPRSQKEACSRMMQSAVKFLWKRTGCGEMPDTEFDTHAACMEFFDRHPQLLKCVESIYGLNSGGEGRNITDLNLQPGLCTGMLYLMGSSGSDADEYLSGAYARSEKALDWANWDQAVEFWTGLAGGSDTFEPVREALKNLVDPELGEGGRTIEKVGAIAKAWELFFVGEEFDEERLRLEYYKDDTTGKLTLLVDENFPSFGGIDKGETLKSGKPPTPEEIAERGAEIKEANRIQHLDRVVKEAKSKPKAKVEAIPTQPAEVNGQAQPNTTKLKDQMLRDIKEAHPGKVVLFPTKDGWKFWGNDADYAGKILKQEPEKTPDGKLKFIKIPKTKIDDVKMRLMAAKVKLAVCEERVGQDPPYEVVDVQGPQKLGAK